MASTREKIEHNDVKLGSFLSRSLPREDHERLFTTEPCVAVFAKEKPVHRHAVLGHHRLYLTDVPPRSLRASVDLQDVQDVRRLHAPPDFLSGREKDEAVHVQICYRREAKPERALLGSIADLSPAILRRFNNTGAGKRSGEKTLPHSLLTQRTIQRTSGRKSGSSSPHGSSHNLIQRSLSPGPATEKSIACTDGFMESSPFPTTSNSASATNPLLSSIITKGADRNLCHSSRDKKKRSPLETSYQSTPHVTVTKQWRTCGSIEGSTTSLLDSTVDIHSSKSSPNLLVDSVASQPARLSAGIPKARNIHSGSHELAKTFSSERDLSKLQLEAAYTERWETSVLDLYILNPNTNFHHHLLAAWEDQKISHTLCTSVPTKPLGVMPENHFFHHFHTLKQELMSATTIESSAQLIQELCTACQKYFIIKRLFWEDIVLFEFLVGKLQHQAQVYTCGKKRAPTATEIEYDVIVLELLDHMLRETHCLSQRVRVLAQNGGRFLKQLSTAIVHLLPSLSTEAELFADELVEHCSGLLRELFRVADQIKRTQVRDNVVSPDWLGDVLAAQPKIRAFCQLVVASVSSLLHMEHHTPQTLVALYRQTSLLHCLVLHAPDILALMRSHFTEEFRYLISVTVARERLLLLHDPLTSDTLDLLQHTKTLVLNE